MISNPRAKASAAPTESPQHTASADAGASTRQPAAPDLRLAGAAVGAWLAALGALGGGTAQAALAAGVAAMVAIGAWIAGHRLRGHRAATAYVVAAIAVGAAAGASCAGAAIHTRDGGPLAKLAERRAAVTVELDIRDDPRQVRGGSAARTSYLVPADLVRVDHAGAAYQSAGRVLVLATDGQWSSLLPGQRVRAEGRLAPPRGDDLTAAVLSARGAPTRLGAAPWFQRAAGTLRAGLQRACAELPPAERGLLPGLVVGDVSRMDPAVQEAFLATGMTHLTAVSGSNIAVVCGLVLIAARRCRAGPRLSAVLAGLAVVGFVILARPSPSVLRAAVMGVVALIALAAGRQRAALPALGATVFVLVVADPALARSAGFTLSVVATSGLLLIAASWRDALRRRRVPAGFAEALAVPAAAQVACAPVIAAMTGTLSLSAVPANLLAVPAIAPTTVLGVLAAVVSPVWPALAQLLAWLASWPARWLVEIARRGADVPGGTLPWPDGVSGGLFLAGALAVVLVLLRWPSSRRLVLAVVVAAAVVVLPIRALAPGWPSPGWLVVACDVGQGDALVIRAGPGAALVVDTGPDPGPVDQCLRRLDITTVPLLVVSHPHADHIGGLAGVLRQRRVGAIALGASAEPVGGRQAVQRAASAHRVPLLTPALGASYLVGNVRISVLGPRRTFVGTRSDPNNNSLVLRAQVAGFSVLLCGDAENDAQRALVDAGLPLRTDVLKVAHHGSAFSEPDLLDAVRPAVALVPVGAGNDYGHPHAAVLSRLRRLGARVLRTDQDGDIAVVVADGSLAVAVRGPEISGRRR